MATATLARPTRSPPDAALDGPNVPSADALPRANVRRAGDFPASEFALIENVPVFAEHETTTRDGRHLKFGLPELQAIVDRCNRRIEDSGDYSAITIGHTPGPEAVDKGAAMPEVVGYAGLFRVGVLGQGESQRYAILADFHVYRDELSRVRKFARRSPEIWLEDKFEEMFLDPIALLGAEAPRLDMGLLYSASRAGRTVEKYALVGPVEERLGNHREHYAAAAGPGPGSVFIPSDRPLKRAAGDSGYSDNVPAQESSLRKKESAAVANITPDDVELIVDALDRLPWVQRVKQMLQEQMPPGPGAATPGEVPLDRDPESSGPAGPAAAPPAEVGSDRPPLPKPPSDRPPQPKKNAADANPNMGYPAAPNKFAAGDGEPDDDEDPDATDLEDERMEYSALHKKYGANEECRRYAALHKKYGGDEDSEYRDGPEGATRESIDVPAGGAEPERNRAGKRRYEANGSAAGTSDIAPAAGSSQPDPTAPRTGAAGGVTGDAADPYRRRGQRERYATQGDVLRLERANQQLQQQLTNERSLRVDAERYSRLQVMRQHFAFDIDKTFELAKYGRMSDDQFEAQCELVESNCRPIPLGSWLPGGDQDSSAAAAAAPARPARTGGPEKYRREHSDRARELCEADLAAGKVADYERVLDDVMSGRR